MPAASFVRVAQEKPIEATEDQTLILADLGAMAITQLQNAAWELLQGTVSENAALSISQQLSSGRWTHDYPIVYDHAREMGLVVSKDMPSEIMELMTLFPETIKRNSGVQFLQDTARAHAHPKPSNDTPMIHLTGYAPREGARHFSLGPWNPKELAPPPSHGADRPFRQLRD